MSETCQNVMRFTPATADRIDRDLAKVVNGKMPPEGLGEPLASVYQAGRIAERAEATAAEATLNAVFDDFLSGKIRGEELPYPLGYVFLAGLWQATDAMRALLEQTEHEADRWYHLATRPRPKVPEQSLADLERRRGYPDRAARIDEANRQRFGDSVA